MKVLCIGDPHFRTNNMIDTDALCKRILEIIDHIHPDFVVVLGDVLDRHETIHVSPLERATRFLKLISEKCLLYVLIGNHDRPNNSTFMTPEHPFTAIKYWPNTYIVDSILDTVIKGHRFIFMPYVYPGRFFEALTYSDVLKDIPKGEFSDKDGKWKDEYIIDELKKNGKGIACIFAHQEFRGAKMGAILSEIGDIWLPKYPFILSGHIHEYDELQMNLIYSGTAYYTNWGETHSKSISLLTFQNDMFELDRKHERIDMKLPRKQLIHVNATDISEYDPPKGDQMKIIITGTFAEIRAAMKSAKMRKWKEDGIIVCVKEKINEKDENSNRNKDGYKSFQQLFSEKIKNLNNPYMSQIFQELFSL